ncbi:MAG: LysM peptidoglycan-binding domain-containing protein [Lentisphaerae bacterium]|jgi:LysM repeat protein|nr:LysM peptidoglycan-binding domain-containing protein [Lentisphaerota bacterium]
MKNSLLRVILSTSALAVAVVIIQGCQTYNPYSDQERTTFGRGDRAPVTPKETVVVEVGTTQVETTEKIVPVPVEQVGRPGTYPDRITYNDDDTKIQYPGLTRTSKPYTPPAKTSVPETKTLESTTADGKYTIYTVKAGDTAGHIANSHGMTRAEFVKLNNLANPNLIKVGQKLKVVSGGKPLAPGRTTAAVKAGEYVVASGDTLGGIAQKHGVKLSDLIAANSIKDPNIVRVGQKLVIPGAGNTPARTAKPTRVITPVDENKKLETDTQLVPSIETPETDETLEALLDQTIHSDMSKTLIDLKQEANDKEPKAEDATSFIEYTMQENEDIYTLTTKFGASPSDIRRINNFSGSTIPVGTTVKVPVKNK